MKSKNLNLAALLVMFAATLTFTSCQKEKNDTNFLTADNSALADESYNDAHNVADEAAQNGSVSYKTEDANSLLTCATVTRDTISMPHLTTIDFGTGCTGIDGKTRKGKILVSYDGEYRAPGTTITVTFDNFFVNDNQVLGTKTIHNNGVNTAGNLTFAINVTGQIILGSGEGTIDWTSQRVREWIAGEPTPSRDDDQYSVTGTASGTACNGNTFEATITSPLIRNLAPQCRRHFVAGTVLVETPGKPNRLIDFGNGNCDDQAVVTINGHSHTITLRR